LLPPPGSRLLLGGAGAGREAAWLRSAGYRVDAFEPEPAAAARCAAVVGSAGTVLTGRYEDLSRAVLDGSESPLAPFAARSYQAAILGWGSYTHVLDPAERSRLLRALVVVCPEGPVLASFFLHRNPGLGPPASRARELGVAIGRFVARSRNLAPANADNTFASHFGFAHTFTQDEIEQLAAQVGRRARWGEDASYPHVAFVRV